MQPPNLLECLPKLAGFVDVNLASLLGVRLPELLSDSQTLESSYKNPSLAREVGRAVKSQVRSQQHLVGMQEMVIRIGLKIHWSTLPIDLQRVVFRRQAGKRWTIIRDGVIVLIFANRLDLVWVYGNLGWCLSGGAVDGFGDFRTAGVVMGMCRSRGTGGVDSRSRSNVGISSSTVCPCSVL